MNTAISQEDVGLEILPLKGELGAIVCGLDMSAGLNKDTGEFLNQLWLDKGLILFRNCPVTPEQHIELSQNFGELEIHPLTALRVPGNDELIQLPPKGKLPAPACYYDDVVRSNRIHWHSDMMYTTYPTRGALLRVLEIPEEAGETGYIDTALAYDGLPKEMQDKIENLEAVHSFIEEGDGVLFGKHWKTFRREGERSVKYETFPDVVHKIVSVHPKSGRKSLNLSPLNLRYVLGMDAADSEVLLRYLVDHCLQDEYRYVHHWQANDIILWDNLRTFHSAYGIVPGAKRLAQRTTLKNIGADGHLLAEAG